MFHHRKWPYFVLFALVGGIGGLAAWALRPDAVAVPPQPVQTSPDSPKARAPRTRIYDSPPRNSAERIGRYYRAGDVYLGRELTTLTIGGAVTRHRKRTFKRDRKGVERKLAIATTTKLMAECFMLDLRASRGSPVPKQWMMLSNGCLAATSDAIAFAQGANISHERLPPRIAEAKNSQKQLLKTVLGVLRATGQTKELGEFVKKHDELLKARDINVANVKPIPLKAPPPQDFTIVKGRALQIHDLVRRYLRAIIARDESALSKCLDPSGATAKQHLADLARQMTREKDSGKPVAARFDGESQLRIRADKKPGLLQVSAVNIHITIIRGGKRVSFRKTTSYRVRQTGKTYRIVMRRDR